MRSLRALAGALACVLLFAVLASALGESGLSWVDPPDVIRPGKSVRLSFSAAMAGDVDVRVKDAAGAAAAVLAEAFPAKAGRNHLAWDGKSGGTALSPGLYTLEVTQGGETAAIQVQVGDPSPVIRAVSPSDSHMQPGDGWHLKLETNIAATLLMTLPGESGTVTLYEALLPAGNHDIPWDGTANGQVLAPGTYVITLTLTDDTGFSSNGEQLHITVDDPSAAPAPQQVVTIAAQGADHAPSDFSSYTCNHESCFFTLPMGMMDEAAIWEAMMQPMTVVKGEQRQVVRVYAEPDKNSEAVGEVTCASQGLHIIETLDNGWTLVEAYSSSIHSSKVKNWAGFFSGYIETSKLETKQPNQKFGLLMDKLTQRMYVFVDGKIYTELLISTGLVNSKQPYNETPAGEFMIVSWTGGFWSGNMWCDMALRINGGILIHEVPCLIRNDVKDYGPFERLLGQKASHGCVRVQKELSPEGVNMRWLWDNLKMNTRVFIWDDVGRNIPIPDAGLPMYYNPDGGQYYHSDAYCKSVRDKYLPLKGFTYGELEDATYAKLTPCSACAAPKRVAEIEALNNGNR